MRRLILLCIFSATLSAVIAFGCGNTTTANVDYGETLGTTWTIDPITCKGSTSFSESYNNFSISSTSADPCANVAVAIIPHTTVPSASAMNLDTATTSLSYDVNATDNGGLYEVSVGDRAYVSSNNTAITLNVPFDTTKITTDYKDNLHIFVRILNKDDDSLADVMGTITTTNVVTVTLSGLPSYIYVAAIFNEYMQASAPSVAGEDISKDADVTGNWSTKKWCAVYSKKYVSKLLGITEGDVASTAQSLVANNAQSIQTIYSALNVTAPNLKEFTGSTDPCGSVLGSSPRYIIYWGASGNSFTPIDTGEIVPSYENDYGQMYVPILSAYWTVATNGQTIYGIIGHQMLHAIQDGYEIFGDTTQGYREGTATAFGASLDQMNESGASAYTPSVRSLSDSDTFLLSNFLMLNVDSSSNLATSFSNQDLFVYTANQYGGGTFDYFYDLFRNLQSAIESDYGSLSSSDDYAARYNPDRTSLFGALNTTLKQLTDAPTLYAIYTDFLQQRAFDHNVNSQLRAGDPTTPGLDADLFAYSASNVAITAIADIPLNPLSIGTELLARLKDVPPLSARVIRITPAQVATTGATINVTLSPSSGSIGTIFQGFAYQNAVSAPISSSMTFPNFGTATTDEILVILTNNPNVSGGTSYSVYSIYFTVSGTSGS